MIESFTTFKRAATDAITGGYVDEINEEMYERTHNNK